MVSVLAGSALKTDLELAPAGGGELAALTELSRAVAEIANVAPNDGSRPSVARRSRTRAAFTGPRWPKVERSYSNIDPTSVGNEGRLVVSELGGRANTRLRAEQLGHQLDGIVEPAVLSNLIKQLESEGLSFEGAEASFELLIRRHAADYRAPFRIVDYTCLVEQRADAPLRAEATVKGEGDGETLHTAADGNGRCYALAPRSGGPPRLLPVARDVHSTTTMSVIDSGAATRARTWLPRIDRRLARMVDDGLRHEHLADRRPPSAIRSSAQSGSRAPSSGAVTSDTSRP